MERKTAADFPQELLSLFDQYVHGGLDRRGFLDGAAKYAVGGATATALFEMLRPNYALAQQVAKDDTRITTSYITYPSPLGYGQVKGLLARPANARGKLGTVLVIHENRGLNPYVEDVARRAAVAGFLALAPDALTSLGGYPGTDEKGVEMQRSLDGAKLIEDWIAGVQFLKTHADSNGKVGAVGFCYGGGICNTLAVRVPDLAASAPFYGRQPAAADVAKIKAPLLIHYAGLDQGVNAGAAAYEEALKANKVRYTQHTYDNVNHGFHNDTTPRYDKAAADLAWQRTVAFFNQYLK
ncbi:MAG: dienelactone hydrolase family protein [Vicinamibacterales bacterium]